MWVAFKSFISYTAAIMDVGSQIVYHVIPVFLNTSYHSESYCRTQYELHQAICYIKVLRTHTANDLSLISTQSGYIRWGQKRCTTMRMNHRNVSKQGSQSICHHRINHFLCEVHALFFIKTVWIFVVGVPSFLELPTVPFHMFPHLIKVAVSNVMSGIF